jgi:uncharacterized membrane protein YphA (DoxX/SURF4 family)
MKPTRAPEGVQNLESSPSWPSCSFNEPGHLFDRIPALLIVLCFTALISGCLGLLFGLFNTVFCIIIIIIIIFYLFFGVVFPY